MFVQYGERLAGVRKIAVLRANAVGDLMFALPALSALADTYPDAEIVLLARRWHRDFLSGRPGPVHRVVVLPPIAGVGEAADYPTDPATVAVFLARMQAERFDLALQLHGGGKYSNPLVSALGARLTAGLQAAQATPLDRSLPYLYFHNEILRLLETVALVGARAGVIEPKLALSSGDFDELQARCPHLEDPLAVLQPGASDPRRCWPPESFALVGDRLHDAGAQVLINGTEAERSTVAAVQHAMLRPAITLTGRLSLNGLAALLARAKVVVSNDTGPLHLAEAVGAATVGIYWIGNLLNSGSISKARHRHATSMRMDCPACGRNCWQDNCGHAVSFVADVPVEAVAGQALALLDNASAAR